MAYEIAVSIICNTYNHEAFIRDALNGFVNQKTSFAFEVLVHDDASTDGTADIVREYEKEYPDIVKPIYEKENQYSQHNGMIGKLQYGRARGKYIAMCEGDDYWTDPYKLQKQYDAMEAHPEVDMCAHAASKVREGRTISVVAPRKELCVIPAGDVILGGGAFLATNTLFYRKCMCEKTPQFRQYFSFDYTLQIWGSLRGGILYLPDNMSVYRVGVQGSWTNRMKANRKTYLEHKKKVLQMLDILANEVDSSLAELVIKMKKRQQLLILVEEHRFHEIKHGEMRAIYRSLSVKQRMRITAKHFLYIIGRKR